MVIPFLIILLLVFLIGSALCSASETALFSLSSMKVKIFKEDKDKRKQLIAYLLSNPNELLVTLMMLNIIMNIMIQNVVANIFGSTSNWWLNVGVPLALTLILGEIIPKSIGLANNEKLSYYSAEPIEKLQKLLLPVRRSLNIISSYLGRFLFFFLQKEKNISIDELEHALKASTQYGVLNQEEAELASGYLQLQQSTVKSLMRPREDVIFFDIEQPVSDLIHLFVDKECSRIPVCQESFENVLGVISSRIFFLHGPKVQTSQDLLPILKKPFFIPETTLAHTLMKNFYESKESLALVVDEYGSISGIISLEDLVEVVVGEISDRRDEQKRYTKAGPDVIIASGKLELTEMEEIFDVELKSEHNMVTVGGWLTEQMGDIPKAGTKYITDDFLFHVLSSDQTRIRRVYIRSLKNHPTKKRKPAS
ncbi:MAG: HlyC/CorC family transporter [Chlamydiae bacterium]|nr:HlyC/CorC family transporter [Chlamydiota bacterium]